MHPKLPNEVYPCIFRKARPNQWFHLQDGRPRKANSLHELRKHWMAHSFCTEGPAFPRHHERAQLLGPGTYPNLPQKHLTAGPRLGSSIL